MTLNQSGSCPKCALQIRSYSHAYCYDPDDQVHEHPPQGTIPNPRREHLSVGVQYWMNPKQSSSCSKCAVQIRSNTCFLSMPWDAVTLTIRDSLAYKLISQEEDLHCDNATRYI